MYFLKYTIRANNMINIRHIGIVVNCFETMVEFYKNILGMKELSRSIEKSRYIDTIINKKDLEIEIIKLMFEEGGTIELLHYRADNKEEYRDNKIWDKGLSHIAISVKDVMKEYLRLTNLGVNFLSKPEISPDNYAKVCFCRDPEGNYIELVQVLEA